MGSLGFLEWKIIVCCVYVFVSSFFELIISVASYLNTYPLLILFETRKEEEGEIEGKITILSLSLSVVFTDI